MESIRRKWKQEIQDLEFAKSTLERQKISLEGELAGAQEEIRGLKMSVSQLSSAQSSLESQLSAAKVYMFEVHAGCNVFHYRILCLFGSLEEPIFSSIILQHTIYCCNSVIIHSFVHSFLSKTDIVNIFRTLPRTQPYPLRTPNCLRTTV